MFEKNSFAAIKPFKEYKNIKGNELTAHLEDQVNVITLITSNFLKDVHLFYKKLYRILVVVWMSCMKYKTLKLIISLLKKTFLLLPIIAMTMISVVIMSLSRTFLISDSLTNNSFILRFTLFINEPKVFYCGFFLFKKIFPYLVRYLLLVS